MQMKYWLSAILLVALPFVMMAQSIIYDNNAEKRSVGSFSSIDASAGVEVVIMKGEETGLAVSVSEPISKEVVKTKVQDGVLYISVDYDWKVWKLPKNFKAKVYVSFVSLESLKASSGATIKGSVKLKELKTRTNSGGIIAIDGVVERLYATAASGGIFKGYDVQSAVLIADVSSGGGVQATVNNEVEAKATSGGYVTFKGEAVIKNINVNSGGSVKKLKS